MTRLRPLALAASGVLVLALTACGGNQENASSAPTSASASASASATVMASTGHWTGKKDRIAIEATTGAEAPAAIASVWATLGKKNQDLMAVQIDNTAGNDDMTLSEATFTSEAGEETTYGQLSPTLEANDAGDSIDTDQYSEIVGIHNQYSSDKYTVDAGTKKTLLPVSPTQAGKKITHATVRTSEGEIALRPAEGRGPVAPDPTASPAAESTDAQEASTSPAMEEETTPATQDAPEPAPSVSQYPDTDQQGVSSGDEPSEEERQTCQAAVGTADGKGMNDYCSTVYGIVTDPVAGPAGKPRAQIEQEQAQCRALDIETATSGAIQYCYTEYGIEVR